MPYAILVVSALLFESALNLPIGSLPLALTREGASDSAAATAMGTGMFAALLASLPTGVLVDRIGRLATLRFAAGLGIVALLGLSAVHGPLLSGVFVGLRSISVVAYMTAEFAYASELASSDRAVSTVATLGMIGNLTFAAAPAIGVTLWQHGVGREMYVIAMIAALAGAALLFALPARYDRRASTVRGERRMLRSAWIPAIVFCIGSTLQGGVNGSLAVLTFHERGIANGAAIFSASAFCSFLLRYPSGRLVDRFGPRWVALPTALMQAVGCVLAARATTLSEVIVAGAFLGTAWAAVVPVSLGLLFEKSDAETRGAAMGAYNLAFSGGAAFGAVLATLSVLAGPGYGLAVAVCAAAPFCALPFVLGWVGRGRRVGSAGAPARGEAARGYAPSGAAGE
jgi:MFS family permease